MRTKIVLSKAALIHNIKTIRRHVGPDKKIIGVIKAQAYGHGVTHIAPLLEKHIDVFAVDDVQELVELRALTSKDIYVLGHVCYEDIEECIKKSGVMVVYDKKTIEMVEEIARKLKTIAHINIKIDALLGRQGVLIDDLPKLLHTLKKSTHIRFRGMYAHFANSESEPDFSHSQRQIDILHSAIQMAKQEGFKELETHISSTAGSLLFQNSNIPFTHVRVGIGLYGLWPSERVKMVAPREMELKPVLSWLSCVAQIKKVPAGFPIGYEGTFVTKKPTTIAVIPVGYSDGYDRGLSNNGEVLINGKNCAILGRIAMNMFVVDVSDVGDVGIDDEVVLIGTQGSEKISADAIAERIDTISYEIVSRISPLLHRTVIEDKENGFL